MSIKLDKYKNLIIITTEYDLPGTSIMKILKILDKLMENKKPFGFVIDARNTRNTKISSGLTIIKWMKQKRDIIKELLLCSVILLKSKNLAYILNKIFNIQKPVSPNNITTDLNEALLYINKYIKIDIPQCEKIITNNNPQLIIDNDNLSNDIITDSKIFDNITYDTDEEDDDDNSSDITELETEDEDDENEAENDEDDEDDEDDDDEDNNKNNK